MLPAGLRRQPKARLPVAIQAGCIPTPFSSNPKPSPKRRRSTSQILAQGHQRAESPRGGRGHPDRPGRRPEGLSGSDRGSLYAGCSPDLHRSSDPQFAGFCVLEKTGSPSSPSCANSTAPQTENPLFAKELRRRRHRPSSHWHLDEMAILALASGRRRRRGSRSAGAAATRQDCSRAAMKLMRKLLKNQHNGSCPFMPQSRTRSTSNAISFPAIRSALSEAKCFRIGGRRLPPEQEPSLRLSFGRSQVHVMVWTSLARHLAQGRAVPRWCR